MAPLGTLVTRGTLACAPLILQQNTRCICNDLCYWTKEICLQKQLHWNEKLWSHFLGYVSHAGSAKNDWEGPTLTWGYLIISIKAVKPPPPLNFLITFHSCHTWLYKTGRRGLTQNSDKAVIQESRLTLVGCRVPLLSVPPTLLLSPLRYSKCWKGCIWWRVMNVWKWPPFTILVRN